MSCLGKRLVRPVVFPLRLIVGELELTQVRVGDEKQEEGGAYSSRMESTARLRGGVSVVRKALLWRGRR